jgi:hypothetical protein
MKLNLKPILFSLAAFLSAWQASEFDNSQRAILGALTCAILGYVSPKKKA